MQRRRSLKETLSILASLICIVPNCKILLVLLLKVNHKINKLLGTNQPSDEDIEIIDYCK
jgi:hypothetical protein